MRKNASQRLIGSFAQSAVIASTRLNGAQDNWTSACAPAAEHNGLNVGQYAKEPLCAKRCAQVTIACLVKHFSMLKKQLNLLIPYAIRSNQRVAESILGMGVSRR